MKRVALLAVAVSLAAGLWVVMPAQAYTPYHTVSYASPKGNANLNGSATPTLDITNVSYGYDQKYLRFTMDLAEASQSPPSGYQEQDFVWRFSFEGTQVAVVYERYFNFAVFQSFPDWVTNTTPPNSDNFIQWCATCYATVNVAKGQVQFFTTISDFNSSLEANDATAPVLAVGSQLKLIEADTYADVGGNTGAGLPSVEMFQADAAVAPKGMSFTV